MTMNLVDLGSVCKIVNGGTPDTKNPNFWGGKNAWITPAEMGKASKREISQTARTITDEGLRHAADLLPVNSVILSTRAPIGHLVINQVPMSFNQGCRGLIPSPELHYLYLYYFLFHSKNLLNSLGTGTTFLELSTSNLKSVKIPLPPLDIQIKKVTWLEETSQELDTLFEKVEKKKHLITELRSSFMSKAFDEESNES